MQQWVTASAGAGIAQLRGLAREVLYTSGSAGVYAAGLSDRVCDMLVATRRKSRQYSVRTYPVLLIHGIWHNQSWAVRLERDLTAAGFGCASVNYATVGCGVPQAAQAVAEHIRQLAWRHDAPRVHVVAHSLGGVVLRYAMAHYGVQDMVASAVTLGTPHRGSPLAFTPLTRIPWVGSMVADVSPTSPVLADLAARPLPASTQWLGVWSDQDVVVPASSARLDEQGPHVRNVHVGDVGHVAMPFDPRVLAVVREHLVAVDDVALDAAVEAALTAVA